MYMGSPGGDPIVVRRLRSLMDSKVLLYWRNTGCLINRTIIILYIWSRSLYYNHHSLSLSFLSMTAEYIIVYRGISSWRAPLSSTLLPRRGDTSTNYESRRYPREIRRLKKWKNHTLLPGMYRIQIFISTILMAVRNSRVCVGIYTCIHNAPLFRDRRSLRIFYIAT